MLQHRPANSPDASRTHESPPAASSRAVLLVAILAAVVALYFGQRFFLPLMVAVVLWFLFRPAVEQLRRWHVPRTIGACLVLGLVVGGGVFGVASLYEPALDWVQRAPESLARVTYKMRTLLQPVAGVSRAAEQMDEITGADDEENEVEIKSPSLSETILSGTLDFFAGIILAGFVLFFLLATGGDLVNKAIALTTGRRGRTPATTVLNETQRTISRYLATVTCINLCLGVAIGSTLGLLGLPNPVLWGTMATLLNFVPYLGGVVGTSITALVALLTFDDPSFALLAPAAYASLSALEGMMITPLILGRRFAIDPCALFLWLLFWGWLWGVPGALLAVPMLTILKIISQHVSGLKPIDRLLSRSSASGVA